MSHQLTVITIGRRLWQISADELTGAWQSRKERKRLGPSPQLEWPDSITCELNLSEKELLELKHGTGISVGFEGKVYEFSRLARDGSFEIVKTW